MKKRLARKFGFYYLIAIVISSCSSTNVLTISVQQPAPVSIPADVAKVGLLNRSLSGDKYKALEIIDNVLSAKGKEFDKDGAENMIIGCYNELIAINKYKEVKIIKDSLFKNIAHGVMPSSLSWEEVERLCRINNVDIVYVLSFYDTETVMDNNSKNEYKSGNGGFLVPDLNNNIRLLTRVDAGWRIYDPVNKFILDEYFINDQVVLQTSGFNPIKTVEVLNARKESVMEASKNLGITYAQRILPYYIRVSREYFVRGSNNFKMAKRLARVGNWDGAAELWKDEVNNEKRKVAGRACYNMAIINEINGNLELAIEWASRSYVDYNINRALDYVRIFLVHDKTLTC
jgi:hypothetical protein